MIRGRKERSKWKEVSLGNVLLFEYGKSFPEKVRQPGPYAVYGSNGIIGRAHKYYLEEPVIIVGRKGSAGEVNMSEPRSWPIDTTYYVILKNRSIYSAWFAYYLLKWLDPRRFIDTTVKPGLNRDRVYEQKIPLPPIPVQEQIVQILQKADEIRRKQQDGVKLTNTVLPTIFYHTFGDPATNPKGWPKEPLRNVVTFDAYHVIPEPGETYMYLAPEHIESHTGKYTGPHPTDGSNLRSAKYRFTREHVLYCKLRSYLNKVILPQTEGICSTELVPIHPGPSLLREFLAIYLRLPFFVSAATQKSQGTKMPRFGPDIMKQEYIIVPPIPLQRTFAMQVEQLTQVIERFKNAGYIADDAFSNLLYRAFSGELTREWEAENDDAIAARRSLYERLPKLIILAFLHEKAKRIARKGTEAFILVTALMKYTFLLQMEGTTKPNLYYFVPYHYGPFAKEIYSDLEQLQAEGFIKIDNGLTEKMRISISKLAKIEELLAELPEDYREDVAAVIDQYGDLEHNSLLEVVYERYPAYAKKSRLHK